MLKRSYNEVKCRIFLKGGVNALLYLDWVLSSKVPQSDQQMLILLKALSLRHPQTAQTTAKVQLWPSDVLILELLHTFMRKTDF